MSGFTVGSEHDLDKYILRNCRLNASKNSSKASLFSVPMHVLSPIDESSVKSPRSMTTTVSSAAKSSEPISGDMANMTLTPSSMGGQGLSCRMCGVTFEDISSQREHYSSEFHRLNLKRKLRGLPIQCLNADRNPEKEKEENDDDDELFSSSSDSSDDEGEKDHKESSMDNLKAIESDMDEYGDSLNDENGEEEVDSIINGLSVRNRTIMNLEDTSLVYQQGSVNWSPYHSKAGVHVTFNANTASSGEWQFSVNSLVLIHIAKMYSKRGLTLYIPDTPTHLATKTSTLEVPKEEQDTFSPWDCLAYLLKLTSVRPVWCVFILRSGRFAGAIFDKDTVLEHKTFRRYTVRAKAGGGQSSHDNKAGKAKSAGAMLRRYGEEALKEDVHTLLHLWRDHIGHASIILLSVPKTMRSYIFEDSKEHSKEESGSVLSKDDERNVFVPFLVKVPTFEEAQLIHAKASHVLFTKKETNDTVPGSTNGSKETSIVPSSLLGSPRTSDLDTIVEEMSEESRLKRREERQHRKQARDKKKRGTTEQQQEFDAASFPLGKSLVRAVKAFGQPSDASPSDNGDGSGGDVLPVDIVLEQIQEQHTALSERLLVLKQPDNINDLQSPLHLAAHNGHTRAVEVLLKAGANPLATNASGKMPVQVAKDKNTRDVFRKVRHFMESGIERIRGEHKEKAGDSHDTTTDGTIEVESEGDVLYFVWEWDAAGVGPALSEDDEVARKEAQKEKEREKKRRAKERKKENKSRELQQAKDAELAKQLQDEEKVKAKEDAKIRAGMCSNPSCAKSLYKVRKTFDLSTELRCCSAPCVLQLRRGLAVKAASERSKK